MIIIRIGDAEFNDDYALDEDDEGQCAELRFNSEMAKVILNEQQLADINEDEVATITVYVSASIKRAAVVKEEVLLAELKTWLDNKCFAKELLLMRATP